MSANNSSAIKPDDIVFDCPHCGKSLAIDRRGAGLVVNCPDCNQPVQVPGLPPQVRRHDPSAPAETGVSEVENLLSKSPEELAEALSAAHQKIARLVETLEEVRERRRVLEQFRADNLARFRYIAKELETIQHAIDRILAHLQDAQTNDVGDSQLGF